MKLRRVSGEQARQAAERGLVKVDQPTAKALFERGVHLIVAGNKVAAYHFFGGYHLAANLDSSRGSFESAVANFQFYLEPGLGTHAAFFVKRADWREHSKREHSKPRRPQSSGQLKWVATTRREYEALTTEGLFLIQASSDHGPYRLSWCPNVGEPQQVGWADVLEIAKKMAQARFDELAWRRGSLFDPEVPFDNPAVFKPAQGLDEDNPPPRLVDVSMLAAKYGGTVIWAPLWPGGRLIQFKDEVRAGQFLKAARKWRSESGVAYITAHRIMQSPTTGKWLVFASVEEPPLIEPGSLFDPDMP